MKRAKVWRSEFSKEWVAVFYRTEARMSDGWEWHPTQADALAHALHEVGLTPTNPEEQS